MSNRPPEGSSDREPEPNDVPMNRAERRAHARGGGPRPDPKERDTGRHNAGPGKRQWTIRRGG